MDKEIAIVYMVAGMSSRFGGKVKQLAEVGKNKERLIEISMNQAIKAGFNKIVLIVGDKTEEVFRDNFSDSFNGVPVLYAKQSYDESLRDKPWGTADAIACLRGIIDCGFVVCNGDDLYGEETFRLLANHLRENNEGATIGYRVINCLPEKGKGNRALFEIDHGYVRGLEEIYNLEREDLKGLKEDDLVSMNIYALHTKDLENINEKVENFKKENVVDRTKEILIQHVLTDLIMEGKIKLKIYAASDKPIGITFIDDVSIIKAILKNE